MTHDSHEPVAPNNNEVGEEILPTEVIDTIQKLTKHILMPWETSDKD